MKRGLLIIMIAATLMASCYKSDLSDTTHPNMGMVVINKIMPDDATLPEGGFTILFNSESYTTSTTTTTIDAILEPGVYIAYIYSNTTEMSIDHNIDTCGNGTIISSKVITDGVVESLSEDLYFGTETITVLADQIVASEVHLSQVTRTIKFNLLLTEGDIDKIESISATLSGVAQQWECVEDIPLGDAVNVYVEFTQGDSLTKANESNNYLTGSIKILGVIGDSQILKLVLTFFNGNTQTITSDVSDQLAGSNDTKSTSITLSGELKLYTEFNSTGTITDWEVSDNDYYFNTNQTKE